MFTIAALIIGYAGGFYHATRYPTFWRGMWDRLTGRERH